MTIARRVTQRFIQTTLTMTLVIFCGVLAGAEDTSKDTAWMELDSHAAALYGSGHYAEAAALTEDALRRAVKAFGPNHVNVAKYQHNLARIYAFQHRYAEGELLYRSALEMVERALGPDHVQTGMVLEGYAELERILGNTANAEALEARARSIRATQASQLELWGRLSNRVEVLSGQGNYADAMKLAKDASRVAEKVFGPNDPRLAQSLSDLSELYRVQGNFAQAEPLQQRALTIRQRLFGSDDPHVVQSLQGLAHLYAAQKKYADAKALYDRLLSMDETALGKNDPTVGGDLSNLAELYAAQDQCANAEPLYRRALAIFESASGPTDSNLAGMMERDAVCLRKLGKPQEAQAMETRVKQIRSGGSPASAGQPPAPPRGKPAPSPQRTQEKPGIP